MEISTSGYHTSAAPSGSTFSEPVVVGSDVSSDAFSSTAFGADGILFVAAVVSVDSAAGAGSATVTLTVG